MRVVRSVESSGQRNVATGIQSSLSDNFLADVERVE